MHLKISKLIVSHTIRPSCFFCESRGRESLAFCVLNRDSIGFALSKLNNEQTEIRGETPLFLLRITDEIRGKNNAHYSI